MNVNKSICNSIECRCLVAWNDADALTNNANLLSPVAGPYDSTVQSSENNFARAYYSIRWTRAAHKQPAGKFDSADATRSGNKDSKMCSRSLFY